MHGAREVRRGGRADLPAQGSGLVPGSIATTRTTSSPYRSSSRDSRSISSPRGGEIVIWTIPWFWASRSSRETAGRERRSRSAISCCV